MAFGISYSHILAIIIFGYLLYRSLVFQKYRRQLREAVFRKYFQKNALPYLREMGIFSDMPPLGKDLFNGVKLTKKVEHKNCKVTVAWKSVEVPEVGSGKLLGRGKYDPTGILCTTFKVGVPSIKARQMFVRKHRLTSRLLLNSMKVTNGVPGSKDIYVFQKFADQSEKACNQQLVNTLFDQHVTNGLLQMQRINYFYIHKGYITFIVPGIMNNKDDFITALDLVVRAQENLQQYTCSPNNGNESNRYVTLVQSLLDALYHFKIDDIKNDISPDLLKRLQSESENLKTVYNQSTAQYTVSIDRVKSIHETNKDGTIVVKIKADASVTLR